MEQKDIEYFRTLLNNMLEEAQHKGDSTLEDLTDSNELFAAVSYTHLTLPTIA